MILGLDIELTLRACFRNVPIRPFTQKWVYYACVGYTLTTILARVYTARTTPHHDVPCTLEETVAASFLAAYLYYTLLHPIIWPLWIVPGIVVAVVLHVLLFVGIAVALVYLFLFFNPTFTKDLYDEYRCLMAPLAFMTCSEITQFIDTSSQK
jgi:hypothetical protein